MPRSINNEINIAEILKDKPQGLKLYLTTHGNCTLHHINDKVDDSICVIRIFDNFYTEVSRSGKLSLKGEVILFPSKEMRDWEKLTWKKGDVLVNDNGMIAMFDGWANDVYTEFNTIYNYYHDNTIGEEEVCDTSCFTKASEDVKKKFIDAIEEHYGGKLNLETLEIEKPKQEFKDGDILVAEKDAYYDKVTFIAKINDGITSQALIVPDDEEYGDNVHYEEYRYGSERTLRPATDSEKQQLFAALEKEGKAWDANKKQIVDLPKKCEFKPFQKVLVRDDDANIWEPAYFSYYAEGEKYPYRMICGSDLDDAMWMQCVAYEGNEGIAFTAKAANDSIS